MPAGAGWEPSKRALDRIYKINKIFRILTADRGIRDTKAPPTSALRDYGLASQAQESVGGGAPTLPLFIPEQIVPYNRGVTGAFFTRPYPDTS